jgi:hypothetical protein
VEVVGIVVSDMVVYLNKYRERTVITAQLGRFSGFQPEADPGRRIWSGKWRQQYALDC